mmetsp:Transcript_11003/g.25795  ORF Transcript_11003/g.25795 Transcript_11003/m.25795 type:complete len:517 (+) Transcript_11003:648-2198(+)
MQTTHLLCSGESTCLISEFACRFCSAYGSTPFHVFFLNLESTLLAGPTQTSIFSFRWSRYLLNYLYAISSSLGPKYSIAEATGLSPTEYGLLTGYGFSLTFVITGLFMGRAADSQSRRNIIAIGCVIWSMALAAMGMATGFPELLLFRLFLGFGEAFSNPASYSMISDLFPPEKRPAANGMFASAVYIGGGLASLSMLGGQAIGWRAMMLVTALFGVLAAGALIFTTNEPYRQQKVSAAAAKDQQGVTKVKSVDLATTTDNSIGATLWFLVSDRHTALLLAAASIRFCGGYVIGGYLPTFFQMKFDNDQYASLNAFVVAVGGFVSSWLGGRITTAWIESAKEGASNRRLPASEKANYLVPAIGSFAGIPFFLITLYSGNFYVALLVGLFGEYLVAESWFGPYMTALQGGVPPSMRGMAVATMLLFANFLGSLASLIVGASIGSTDGSHASLGTIILVRTFKYVPLNHFSNPLTERSPPHLQDFGFGFLRWRSGTIFDRVFHQTFITNGLWSSECAC